MDIFDIVSREHHKLDSHFDFIYSSSRYGQLKLDDVLLQKAMREGGATSTSTVLVDDSLNSHTRAMSYGVETFPISEYEASQPAFRRWLEDHYDY
jgi:FMN phosphatase YigB (HAD superfamily)